MNKQKRIAHIILWAVALIALAVNAVSLEATGGVAFFVTIAATIAACIGVSTACAPEKNR